MWGGIRMPIRIKNKIHFRKNLWFHCGTVNTHSSKGVVQIVKSPGNDDNVIDI